MEMQNREILMSLENRRLCPIAYKVRAFDVRKLKKSMSGRV